jgi:hypothetical protein
MKKILIILSLLLIETSYGQTLDSLKESSVVYVKFNHKKNQEMFSQINMKKEKTGDLYYMYFNKNQYEYLIFSHIYNVPESQIEFVNKSFLKKNKQITVDSDYLTKLPLAEAVQIFSGKIVFIIDSEDMIGKKIKLKQVRVQSSIMHEM